MRNHRTLVAGPLCMLSLFMACSRETVSTSNRTVTKTTAAKAQDLRNAKVKKVIGTVAIEQTTSSRLGSQIGPDGTVTAAKDTFKSGEPIVLTVVIQLSPPHLQMSARWYDPKGKMIEDDRKEMNGARSASFSYRGKKLKPGKYHVVAYWGGNIASEHDFTVTK